MAYATVKQQQADILIVCEQTNKRVNDNRWLKDRNVNVAIIILNRGLNVVDHKVDDGYVVWSWGILDLYAAISFQILL